LLLSEKKDVEKDSNIATFYHTKIVFCCVATAAAQKRRKKNLSQQLGNIGRYILIVTTPIFARSISAAVSASLLKPLSFSLLQMGP
jgi:hypothetical protein